MAHWRSGLLLQLNKVCVCVCVLRLGGCCYLIVAGFVLAETWSPVLTLLNEGSFKKRRAIFNLFPPSI